MCYVHFVTGKTGHLSLCIPTFFIVVLFHNVKWLSMSLLPCCYSRALVFQDTKTKIEFEAEYFCNLILYPTNYRSRYYVSEFELASSWKKGHWLFFQIAKSNSKIKKNILSSFEIWVGNHCIHIYWSFPLKPIKWFTISPLGCLNGEYM